MILINKLRKKFDDFYLGKYIDEIDVVVRYFERKRQTGIMIDIGAHYGNALTPFAKKGWTIYAYEPDKKNLKVLRPRIEDFPKVYLDTRAVTDKDNQELPFFTSEVSSGISGLSSFHPSHEQSDIVKTTTLKTICTDNKINDFLFLKIDTEGYDYFVLNGFDWENHPHPDVVLVEFENKKTKPLGYTFFELAAFLEKQNYRLLISEWNPIIEYGTRHTWKHFIKDYKQVTDEKAWGNIIAVKEGNFKQLISAAKKTGKVI